MRFRGIVDAGTEDFGVPCVEAAGLRDDEVSALWRSNVGSLIHLPLSSTLLAPGQEITSLSLKESVDIYILGLPVNASQASS